MGLEGVKTEVDDLIKSALDSKLRQEQGLPVLDSTMHLIFSGPPGTGKTTMARDIGELYHSLGLIEKSPEEGGFAEYTRSDLVGGYEGQTAIKTREALKAAKGGVIFIDEAYALSSGRGDGNRDSYGKEAVEEILTFAENNRDNTVIILAGYPEDMDALKTSNSGFPRRFPRTIEFASYSVPERLKIAEGILRDGDYRLSDRKGATAAMRRAVMETGEGNAGDVRNLIDAVRRAQRARVWARAEQENTTPTRRDLQLIIPEDINTGAALFAQSSRPRDPLKSKKRPARTAAR